MWIISSSATRCGWGASRCSRPGWRQATWQMIEGAFMPGWPTNLSLFFSFLLKNKAETLEGQRGILAARAERCDLGMAIRSWNAFFHRNVNADGDWWLRPIRRAGWVWKQSTLGPEIPQGSFFFYFNHIHAVYLGKLLKLSELWFPLTQSCCKN